MIRNLVTSTLAAAFLALALGGCDLCCGDSASTTSADPKAASLDGPAVCPMPAAAAHGGMAADAVAGGAPACCPMDGACPDESAEDCADCPQAKDCDGGADCDMAGECGKCSLPKECDGGKCEMPAKAQD